MLLVVHGHAIAHEVDLVADAAAVAARRFAGSACSCRR